MDILSHVTTSTAQRYLLAVGSCLLLTILTLPLRDAVEISNIVLLFLLVVFLISVRLGRGPAIMASFAAVALFDFFFVPPHLSFAVSDVQYLITFAVLLSVGLTTAHLTASLREQADLAARRERETRELYEMARELGTALTLEQVAQIPQRFLATTRHLDSALFFDNSAGRLEIGPIVGHRPGSIEWGFIQACFAQGKPIEMDTLAGSGMAALYLPLQTPLRIRGVLAISPRDTDEDVLRAQRPLLETIASLIALAAERVDYVDIARRHTLQIESEKLRNSILSALSHDLRTPLTALVGLAESLALSQPPLPAPAVESATALVDQAQAMNRLLGKLLDMARLQSGRLKPRKEWQPVEEVIGAALRLLGAALPEERVQLRLPPDLPLVHFDAILIERVLGNLLENAAKYAPADTPVTLSAVCQADKLQVCVEDHGPGFPPGMDANAFDLFIRGQPESATAGVGLGLAICKSIIVAHEGDIHVENLSEGGARVCFTLPLGSPPSIEEELP